MPIPFELIMEQTPVSYQTRKKERRGNWRQDVESAARQVWGLESPVTASVMITITYIFDDTPIDLDNMAKPILDGLKGVVFQDDRQVFDLLCRMRDRKKNLRFRRASPELLSALATSKQALHIKVEAMQELEVEF